MSEYEAGLTLRSVTPGWQAIVTSDDGTATKYWAPTRERAREKALNGD